MSLYSRREALKLGLFSSSAVGLLAAGAPLLKAAEPAPAAPTAKPNSRVNGVHIGLNVPYSFRNNSMDADGVLAGCVQLGVSGVEIRSQPIEAAMGLPAGFLPAGRGGRGGQGQNAAAPTGLPPEQRAIELSRWRVNADLDKARTLRRKYEEAGVFIEILKFDNIYTQSDEVTDYFFELARAVGAHAISCEMQVADTKRLGAFADRHRIPVGYHNHTQKPGEWETAFGHAKFNGANVDIGHYIANNDTSVVDFLKKYPDRVTHLHIKDRKRGTLANDGANVVFGEGDTPIVDVLRLIRDNRWQIQATIEYEYPLPPGSDPMKELAKSIDFCRRALAS